MHKDPIFLPQYQQPKLDHTTDQVFSSVKTIYAGLSAQGVLGKLASPPILPAIPAEHYRFHIALVKDIHSLLCNWLKEQGAIVKEQHFTDEHYDTEEFSLLFSERGGGWLRCRRVEEEDQRWCLRLCQKVDDECFIPIKGMKDEQSIARFLSDNQFKPDSLKMFASIPVTRKTYYLRGKLSVWVECAEIDYAKYAFLATCVCIDRSAAQDLKDLLPSWDIFSLPIRSKVVEYIHRRFPCLYSGLERKGIVPKVPFWLGHITKEPTLKMSAFTIAEPFPKGVLFFAKTFLITFTITS